MYQFIVAVLSLLFVSQVALADICPSTDDIKHNTLIGWKVYDSDDGTLLPLKRSDQFKKSAEQFALAEWKNAGTQKGSIHCYYRDHNGSNLEAYLAKESLLPENAKKHWYQVSGALQCAANVEMCEFKALQLIKQLAKK